MYLGGMKPLLPNQKAYVNAGIFISLYLLLKPFDWEVNKGLLVFAAVSWGLAVVSDLLGFYKRIADSMAGKAVLLVVIGAGANVAIASSAQVVNGLVGIDPSQFTHTIAFVSIFTALALVLLAMAAFFVLGAGIVLPYLLFSWTNDDRHFMKLIPWYKPAEDVPYRRLTVTVQGISFLALCWIAFSWSTDSQNGFGAFVERKASWFLYTFEMYQKAPCPLSADQRVAFLGDGQVLIADKAGEGFTFQVVQCTAGT